MSEQTITVVDERVQRVAESNGMSPEAVLGLATFLAWLQDTTVSDQLDAAVRATQEVDTLMSDLMRQSMTSV